MRIQKDLIYFLRDGCNSVEVQFHVYNLIKWTALFSFFKFKIFELSNYLKNGYWANI